MCVYGDEWCVCVVMSGVCVYGEEWCVCVW